MTEMGTVEVKIMGPLTDEQHARIAALEAARAALQSNSVFGPGTLPSNRGSGDLTYLAEWILEGYESHNLHADSDLETARRAGYSEAITDAIKVTLNHASLTDPDLMSAIRRLAPNADESRTFDDDDEDV